MQCEFDAEALHRRRGIVATALNCKDVDVAAGSFRSTLTGTDCVKATGLNCKDGVKIIGPHCKDGVLPQLGTARTVLQSKFHTDAAVFKLQSVSYQVHRGPALQSGVIVTHSTPICAH